MTNEDTTTFPEKRRAKRTQTPSGSTALLKFGSGSMDSAYINDISENGILLSDYPNKEKLPLNSSINDIFVYIPPHEKGDKGPISLLLCNCKIVRSFFDQNSQTTCYGIEFQQNSNYVKEKIENIIDIHSNNGSLLRN